METYVIRVTTKENLYADYIVEAESIVEARNKAKEAYLRDYPEANEDVKFALMNLDKNKFREIAIILKND